MTNGTCCGNQPINEQSTCPVCGTLGKKAANETVLSLVVDSLKNQVGENDYYLCMSEECEAAYFSRNQKIVFNITDISVPIWFKKVANPKYACYCSKVTESQVIDAVKNGGAKNVADVIKITGAMSRPNCLENNPQGFCCHNILQQAIDKAKN